MEHWHVGSNPTSSLTPRPRPRSLARSLNSFLVRFHCAGLIVGRGNAGVR